MLRGSSIARPLKFALIDGFLQVSFPVLLLWVRGNYLLSAFEVKAK